jgi:hypothetical protein
VDADENGGACGVGDVDSRPEIVVVVIFAVVVEVPGGEIYGAVGVAGENRGIASILEQVAQLEGYAEVYIFLHEAVSRHRARFFAAVAGVDRYHQTMRAGRPWGGGSFWWGEGAAA